jgi:2-dehydropantoate 2-reductase
MRWVIVGAGAVGGVVGGRLALAGADVVLVARGAHLDALRREGLLLRTPDGDNRVRVPAVGAVSEVDWRPGDVAVLAVKSMDTEAVVRDLDAVAGPAVPVVCLQNGVANEPAALRRAADVYGVCVMLPASHIAPGVVVQHCSPTPGILDLGRYPDGVDATAERLAAGLRGAGFVSLARPDIMRWKHTKLLMNLGNAVEALCGRVDGSDALAEVMRAEGGAVLAAAGIAHATFAEDRERRGDILVRRPIEDAPRAGGSSWQSLARATGTVEADFLNGEIALLGRLHGVATPYNALAQRLVGRAAREGRRPGSLSPTEFLAHLREPS